MRWRLSEAWAADANEDDLWTLFRRDGSRWVAVGFYPTAGALLQGLLQKLTRGRQRDADLVEHIRACAEEVSGIVGRLAEQVRLAGSSHGEVQP